MNGLVYTRIDNSPVGALLLAGDDDGLRVLEFQMGSRARAIDPSWTALGATSDSEGVRTRFAEYF